MRKLLLGLAAIGLLCSSIGCANGPIRQWFRGAPCNTCNPPAVQPFSANFAGSCDTGTCSNNTTGSGLLGGMFRPNNAPAVSVPASAFNHGGTAPAGQLGTNNPELYGNTNNAGRLETPPIGAFN